ncbi:MAG: hypothetical protein H7239_13655 [Flavobacterium sp.]|nr:hypothetical protein [Flavobacterium sp.]
MKKLPKILIITIVIVCGILIFKKSQHLTKKDIEFNPYKVGDSLFFQSTKNEKDTIIITSIYKQKLTEKCYSLLTCIPTYLFGETWEGYYVNSEFPNNHGEAWDDILTIRAEKDGTKTIMFSLYKKDACWYGNNDMENNANKILNLPTIKFERGQKIFNDVIIIPSTNKEYRDRDDFIAKMYWSKSQGLVGFDKLNGDKWTIVKK